MNRGSTLGVFAALCVAAWTFCGTANAAPVTASYTGSVGGYTFGPEPLASAVPVGTSVAWSFGFDDAFLGIGVNDFGALVAAATQTVAGTLQVGSSAYVLDHMQLFSVSYTGSPSSIVSYTFEISGSGPAIAGGDLFALLATFDTALDLAGTSVGFGFTTVYPGGLSSTEYQYLNTTGEYALRRTSVPEPSSLGLLGAALALAGVARRRRGVAAAR